MYIYVYLCIPMYIYVDLCMSMYIYVYLSISTCIYVYPCIYVDLCIYMYMYTYIYIYTYICITLAFEARRGALGELKSSAWPLRFIRGTAAKWARCHVPCSGFSRGSAFAAWGSVVVAGSPCHCDALLVHGIRAALGGVEFVLPHLRWLHAPPGVSCDLALAGWGLL